MNATKGMEEMVEETTSITIKIEKEMTEMIEMVEKEAAENKEMIEETEIGEIEKAEGIEMIDSQKRSLCMWIRPQDRNQTTKKYCNSG